MSVEGHIESLQRKHAELESKLLEAERHPSTDETVIHNIKREKLKIKDELAKLKSV